MFKTIIFECGVIHVCSSSCTCEIILWMIKGVIVTKENSHTSFLNVEHFYKLRGEYSSPSGVTLTMFSIWRPPAEIFGAPTK